MIRATSNISVLICSCFLAVVLYGGSLHSSFTGKSIAAEEAPAAQAAPAAKAEPKPNPLA